MQQNQIMDTIDIVVEIFRYLSYDKTNRRDFMNLRKVSSLWCKIIDQHFLLRSIQNNCVKITISGRNYFSKIVHKLKDCYILWYPRSNKINFHIPFHLQTIDLFELNTTDCWYHLFEMKSLLCPKFMERELNFYKFNKTLMKVFQHKDSRLARLKKGMMNLFSESINYPPTLGNFHKRMIMYEFFSKKFTHIETYDYQWDEIVSMMLGEPVSLSPHKGKKILLSTKLRCDQLLYSDLERLSKFVKPVKRWDIIVYYDFKQFLKRFKLCITTYDQLTKAG